MNIIEKYSLVLKEKPNLSENRDYLYLHPDIWKTDSIRLKKYLTNAIENDGGVICKYEKKIYNGIPYGRYYVIEKNTGMATQLQWNKIKSTLCIDQVDIDIINCHPVILKHLYKNKIPSITDEDTKYLSYYINNRDKIINEFNIKLESIKNYNELNLDNKTKKDMVKNLYTRIIYGGNISSWCSEFNLSRDDYILPDNFMNFKKEIKKIKKKLLGHVDYKDLIENICASRKVKKMDTKFYNSVFSIILQDVESNIVYEAMKYIQTKTNYELASYNYDGFQIYKSNTFNTENLKEVLKDINKYINDKIKIPVKFIIKPFREPLDLTKLENVNVYQYKNLLINFIYRPDDESLTNLIKYYMDNTINCNDHYYIYEKNIWYETTPNYIQGQLHPIIYSQISKDILEYLKQDSEIFNNDSRLSDQIKLKNKIYNLIGQMTVMNRCFKAALMRKSVCSVKFDNNEILLNAPNGTLNLLTMELQNHNRSDYITKCISVDIPTEILNKDLKDNYLLESANKIDIELYNLLKSWLDPNNIDINYKEVDKIIEYFLFIISICMDGRNTFEKAIILTGKLSRNGKSSFIDLLKNTFNNYIGYLPLEFFTEKRNSSSQAQPELLSCKGVRFINISEVDIDNNKLGTHDFKMLTGNDTIETRDLYARCRDMVKFKMQGTLLFLTNDNIAFKKEEGALTNRLCYFTFPNLFGDSSMPEWNPENPNHKNINTELKTKINSGYYNSSFIKLLLLVRLKHGNNYNNLKPPKYFKEDQKENLRDVDSIKVWCDENLVVDRLKMSLNNHYDISILNRHPNNNGKNRILTLDYIYSKYVNDVENPIDDKNFYKRITTIYNDLYNSKLKTKRFGGKKKYLKNIRFIEHEFDD